MLFFLLSTQCPDSSFGPIYYRPMSIRKAVLSCTLAYRDKTLKAASLSINRGLIQ